jgi:hypothetical protein
VPAASRSPPPLADRLDVKPFLRLDSRYGSTAVIVAGGVLLLAALVLLVMYGRSRQRDFLNDRLGEDWDPRLRRRAPRYERRR